MKILLASDAWRPQVNGVVRTLSAVTEELAAMGHRVITVTPDRFSNFPCPTYPEIRLAITGPGKLGQYLDRENPDRVHIATEGPIGWGMRRACIKRKIPFSTSFHTKFPEYIHARCRLPVSISYATVRRFHNAAGSTMVATKTLMEELDRRGFRNLRIWGRGVDTELFKPGDKSLIDVPRPALLYVGRVAVEKNIQAFLDMKAPGTKVVVGDGPQLETLKSRYPEVRFLGPKFGEELASFYAAADVFVFPSLTDTFGNVLLEALASGVPVAAFPVTGPIDVITDPKVGALDDDLGRAVEKALTLDPADCRSFAENRSWRACAEQFFDNLVPIKAKSAAA